MSKVDGRRTEECKQKHKELSTTHGMSDTRLYNIWCNMKSRCYNKANPEYKHYGGRGIKICEEWKNDFLNFYKWSCANGYLDDLTIERINVNQGYCPENCCWADRFVQGNNTRRNHYLTFNGETKTMAEWAKDCNINYYVLRKRIHDNWDIQDALTKPINSKNVSGVKFSKGKYTYLVLGDLILSQSILVDYIGVPLNTFGYYLSKYNDVNKTVSYYCNKYGKDKNEAIKVSTVNIQKVTE